MTFDFRSALKALCALTTAVALASLDAHTGRAAGATPPPAAAALAQARGAIAAALAREGDFRGSEKKPAHEAAFEGWLKTVDRALKESAGAAELVDWRRFRALKPAGRAMDPLWPAALREYAALRYGPDLLVSTRRLVRCRTVGGPRASEGAGLEFRRATSLMDSLALAHGLTCTSASDGMSLEIAARAGAPGVSMMGHLDVAPAGPGWSFDPWQGAAGDSTVSGRGAVTKGAALAAFFALRARMDADPGAGGRLVLSFDGESDSPMKPPSGWLWLDDLTRIDRRATLEIRLGTSFGQMTLEPMNCQWRLNRFSIPQVGPWVPDHVESIINPIGPNTAVAVSQLASRVRRFNTENSRARLTLQRQAGGVVVAAEGRMADAGAPEQGQNAVIDLVMFLQDFSSACPSPAVWVATFLAENVAYEKNGRGLGVARKDSLGAGTSVCVTGIRAGGDSASATLLIRHPGLMTADELLARVRERVDIFNRRYFAGLEVSVARDMPAAGTPGVQLEGAVDAAAGVADMARPHGVDETVAVERVVGWLGAVAGARN